MAFLDFSADQYIKFADTSETIRMGSFKTANNEELQHMRTTIIIEEAVPTLETLTVEIHAERSYNSKIFESSASSLSAITDASTLGAGKTFIGWVRMDFNRQPINKNITYYPLLRLDNYTRIIGGFTIGFAYDFPFEIYSTVVDALGDPLVANLFYQHPIAMQLFSYKEV